MKIRTSSTARGPRDIARSLASTWKTQGELTILPLEELRNRRDTLLSLEASCHDGKPGKFPGASLLAAMQDELAQRGRRMLRQAVAAAQSRQRPPDGAYTQLLKQVTTDRQTNPLPKYHQYA
jgi:hypothetical protein